MNTKLYTLWKENYAYILFFLSIITLNVSATGYMLNKYTMHNVVEICALEMTLKELYLKAFEQVYKDYWTKQFEQLYVTFFDRYIEKLQHDASLVLMIIKKIDNIAGWMLLQHHEQSVIIECICVDPAYQRQGIGRALIFSIKDYMPEIQSILVSTRKINAFSAIFYEQLGFVKTDSIFPGCNPAEKQGYEYALGQS